MKLYKTFLTKTLFLLATITFIFFFSKNIGFPQGEKKEVSSTDKSVQMHDDNSNNSGINNQVAIRKSKENQSKALDNSVDNSNGKEIKEQSNGSLHHHPDHIDVVKATGRERKKTVAIVGDSIIRNIPRHSLITHLMNVLVL